MAIIKSPAVVLKCINYRETSKIITFYSLTHGKIRCIAKGVRKTNTKWGGSLQSMAYLKIIFYYKENRTLHLLSNAEHVQSLNNIFRDYEKMKIGYRIIELVDKLTVDYNENPKLFQILINAILDLDNATKNHVNVLFKFEFELAEVLGFAIDLLQLQKITQSPKKVIDRKDNHIYYYNIESSISEDFEVRDSGNKNIVLNFLETLSKGNIQEILEFNLLKSSYLKIDNFFESHFREHIENLGSFKSKKVLKFN